MASARRADAAKVAAKSEALTQVPARSHFITGGQKVAPAKDGHYTKDAVEDKSYEQWTSMFTAETADSRRRPHISISVCAQTLLALREEWRTLRASHILGAGVDPLLKLLDANAGALAVLNTFGTPGIDRSPAAIAAAIKEFLKHGVQDSPP